MRLLRRYVLVLGVVLCASMADAADQTLIGKKLLLRDDADTTRKRVVAVTGDNILVGNGSPSDPVLNGGSLRVLTTDGCTGPCDTTYPLPAGGWSYIGPLGGNIGYKFRDAAGPITLVVVRSPQRVKVVGKGAPLGHELAADPQPVDVVVTTGDERYCAAYGGTVSFTVDSRFLARNAPAPSVCPPLGSTTTTIPSCVSIQSPCGACGGGFCSAHIDPDPPANVCANSAVCSGPCVDDSSCSSSEACVQNPFGSEVVCCEPCP